MSCRIQGENRRERAARRRAPDVRRLAFPPSLTREQRETANIAEIARRGSLCSARLRDLTLLSAPRHRLTTAAIVKPSPHADTVPSSILPALAFRTSRPG